MTPLLVGLPRISPADNTPDLFCQSKPNMLFIELAILGHKADDSPRSRDLVY